jgi:hypothetical protein
MEGLIKEQVEKHPEGWLFSSMCRRPYTETTAAVRFSELRDRAGVRKGVTL